MESKQHTPAPTTGKLVYFGAGLYPNRSHFMECVDCKTTYPIRNNESWCNGHVIDVCPWDRPDSKPWRWGRGA